MGPKLCDHGLFLDLDQRFSNRFLQSIERVKTRLSTIPKPYILVAETLGKALNALKDKGTIKGIHITPRVRNISHLQFVDDVVTMNGIDPKQAKSWRIIKTHQKRNCVEVFRGKCKSVYVCFWWPTNAYIMGDTAGHQGRGMTGGLVQITTRSFTIA